MAAPDFIFMLTRGDVTIADARRRLPDVLTAGVRHIGFKDVGLPFAEMAALARDIRGGGAAVYLEMVSLGADAEAAGARTAAELGADALMGGVRPVVVEPILAGSPVRYFPFPGQIEGHPSRLVGDVAAIAESARRLAEREAVSGLDLLAYRAECVPPELTSAVCRAAGAKPVVVAGSIDCAERIAALASAGAAAFTVGTAALDGAFPCGAALGDQLAYILALAQREGEDVRRRQNGRL